MNTPEHNLQVMIKKFVTAHVPQPHYFSCSDRSKPTSMFSHAREKARGIVAGEPDTKLLVPGLPSIHIELKAPGNKPTPKQEYIGDVITASGHKWGWCYNVFQYAQLLLAFGVPLIGRWEITADHYDSILAGSAVKKTQAKRISKLPTARPTQAQLKRIAAIRARGVEP